MSCTVFYFISTFQPCTVFYFISTFPPCTVAYFNVVGFFVGVGTVNVAFLELSSVLFAPGARASCATPTGESAISLMSRVVRESLSGAARDWRRRVVGPLNWRNSCFCRSISKSSRYSRKEKKEKESLPCHPRWMSSPMSSARMLCLRGISRTPIFSIRGRIWCQGIDS